MSTSEELDIALAEMKPDDYPIATCNDNLSKTVIVRAKVDDVYVVMAMDEDISPPMSYFTLFPAEFMNSCYHIKGKDEVKPSEAINVGDVIYKEEIPYTITKISKDGALAVVVDAKENEDIIDLRQLDIKNKDISTSCASVDSMDLRPTEDLIVSEVR